MSMRGRQWLGGRGRPSRPATERASVRCADGGAEDENVDVDEGEPLLGVGSGCEARVGL